MTNEITPYLFFQGNCKTAMEFYHKVFGGELNVMTYKQAQGDACPAGLENHVMHSNLKGSGIYLMASDGSKNENSKTGDNIHLSLNCRSGEEIEKYFKALSEKGTVKMPLADTFWGARFGMLIDQYGHHWMLNFEKGK